MLKKGHDFFLFCYFVQQPTNAQLTDKLLCCYESWNSIFNNNEYTDVDSLFNSFRNTYLRIFFTSFPNKRITEKSINNNWITTGIKISCNHKQYLYLLTKNNDDPNLKKLL